MYVHLVGKGNIYHESHADRKQNQKEGANRKYVRKNPNRRNGK
jgi:hypothetical protein